MKNIHNSNEPPDFSLVLGGPLFQLLMRLRLTTPALDFLKKRIIYITLFAWLPLLLLSLIEGKAWGNIGVPFLFDMEDQTRFLIALPLLIGAELLVHKQLRLLVGQFIDRNIITEKVLPSFKELIDSAMKLRNSVIIELILLILAFVGGHYLWNTVSIMETIASALDLGMPLPIAPAHIFPWQVTGIFLSVDLYFNLSLIDGTSGYSFGPVFYGRVRDSTSILFRPTPTMHAALDF